VIPAGVSLLKVCSVLLSAMGRPFVDFDRSFQLLFDRAQDSRVRVPQFSNGLESVGIKLDLPQIVAVFGTLDTHMRGYVDAASMHRGLLRILGLPGEDTSPSPIQPRSPRTESISAGRTPRAKQASPRLHPNKGNIARQIFLGQRNPPQRSLQKPLQTRNATKSTAMDIAMVAAAKGAGVGGGRRSAARRSPSTTVAAVAVPLSIELARFIGLIEKRLTLLQGDDNLFKIATRLWSTLSSDAVNGHVTRDQARRALCQLAGAQLPVVEFERLVERCKVESTHSTTPILRRGKTETPRPAVPARLNSRRFAQRVVAVMLDTRQERQTQPQVPQPREGGNRAYSAGRAELRHWSVHVGAENVDAGEVKQRARVPCRPSTEPLYAPEQLREAGTGARASGDTHGSHWMVHASADATRRKRPIRSKPPRRAKRTLRLKAGLANRAQ
jgi:hypothetical protein